MSVKIDISSLVKTSLIYKLTFTGLTLSAVDMVLTFIGLNIGLKEANPLSNFSLPFLAFKFGIWLSLALLTYFFSKRKSPLGLFTVSLTSILGVCIYTFIVALNSTLIVLSGGVV